MPLNSNLKPSHVVYRIKTEENSQKRMKSRLYPNGNRAKLRKTVRKDCATAQFDIIRLLLSHSPPSSPLGCHVPILKVHTSKVALCEDKSTFAFHVSWTVLWRLHRLPYGITEADRQCAKEIESCFVSEYGLERVFGLSQLYIKRDTHEKILITPKVTDDILLASKIPALNAFITVISERYAVWKSIINDEIYFNICSISQDTDGNIYMDSMNFLNKIKQIQIEKPHRKHQNEKAKKMEIDMYRSLAGALLWLGCALMPQASCLASFIQ